MQLPVPDVPESAELDRLAERAASDDRVVGLVLSGSAARAGMATRHSDVDVYVVLREPSDDWSSVHSPAIDIPVTTLDELRDVPEDPNQWWGRYAFAHARVLLDRSGASWPRRFGRRRR